jgi:hypothetical protein
VSYDQDFDQFFDDLARSAPPARAAVWKWDLVANPPRAIRVVSGGLSPAAMSDVLALLAEVNRESVPDMFGGRLAPLPVVVGSASEAVDDGLVVVEFWDEETIADGLQVGGVRRWGRVRLKRATFESTDRIEKKYVLVHELFHVAFATHISVQNQSRFPSSAMGARRATSLSNADRFASWLVYQDGLAPGNMAPDVNPTCASPSGAAGVAGRLGGAPERTVDCWRASPAVPLGAVRRVLLFRGPTLSTGLDRARWRPVAGAGPA